MSVRRQCELLGLNRSSWHYRPLGESAANLALMRRIDEQYLKDALLRREEDGQDVRHQSWPRRTAAAADGPGSDLPQAALSQNTTEHRIYPYLLRNLKVVRPDQVWASDITYVPMPQGWMYLTVVMDWFSRCVLSWRLSNTLDGLFCLEALEAALLAACRKSSTRTRACSTRRKRLRAAWRRWGCG